MATPTVELDSGKRIRYPITRAKRPEKILCSLADLIENFGWTQGMDIDYQTGAVCLGGGLRAVMTGDPDLFPPLDSAKRKVWNQAEDLLKKRIAPDFSSVEVYNDDVGRKKEEVLAVLRGDGC